MAKVDINFNGTNHTIETGDNETILNRALDQGIELPFGCMSGSCTTCVGILMEGEVTMDVDMALSADDKSNGQILTCQAVPKTDYVRIVVKS